jgi:hypothetical protein
MFFFIKLGCPSLIQIVNCQEQRHMTSSQKDRLVSNSGLEVLRQALNHSASCIVYTDMTFISYIKNPIH